MMLTFTVLAQGARFERRFTPDQVVEASLNLRARIDLLREDGFTVLIQGDDNVVWIAHQERAAA